MHTRHLPLAFVLAAGVVATPTSPLIAEAAAQYQSASSVDRMIERAFDDVLGRRPDSREMRLYRSRVYDDDWSERDIRNELRRQRDERDRYGNGNNGGYGSGYGGNYNDNGRPSSQDVDRVITRAYQDILGRDPDTQGLREYRRRMIDDGWSERQVRDALRRSNEKAELNDADIDRMITRAYRDVLERAPDPAGLSDFRNQVKRKGWTESDVRQALRESPEYREKNTMTEAKARDIVRNAYRSVLGRDPDPGADVYVQKVLREKWTERDVANELRKSDEYRNRR
ncbi:hypothetical protein TBR22_A10190 [Luteitalea sp. TBR-22]|uniref:DUF4214 domain-containing protein n=1 Tax=Luteitalea sp. TBR-22 TaxID=2802971 RepID=UPI001AF4EC88|nr:DUF4214 domain-containing protein [Luteitalea sp. TBR-22]BCS31815.1 hypothetical protein TBR22_A10190 [Luteitalea sp. TBR-22]